MLFAGWEVRSSIFKTDSKPANNLFFFLTLSNQSFSSFTRVWKGFRVICEVPEIESVNRVNMKDRRDS